MILSDVPVKRPVFATVSALVLLSFGALSFGELPVSEYPTVNPPMVSIRTAYLGASVDEVETLITLVLEDQVRGIEGIKSIRSSSRHENSFITVEFELDRDLDDAANDVRDRVGRVGRMLPEEADAPHVAKFDSDQRNIVDRFGTGGGVVKLRDGAQIRAVGGTASAANAPRGTGDAAPVDAATAVDSSAGSTGNRRPGAGAAATSSIPNAGGAARPGRSE